MPPEATNSPALPYHLPVHRKHHHLKRMEVTITKRRLVHLLLLILASFSIFRLLRLAFTTFPYSPVPALLLFVNHNCSSTDSTCDSFSLQPNSTPVPSPAPTLSIKEFKFLLNLVSSKAPCNLLIFGLDPQYLMLAEINSGGKTIILEDNPEKLWLLRSRSNSTKIHKVNYPIPAKEAYKMLKQARRKRSCSRYSGPLESSKCRLALTALPMEVYKHTWDVIIVDGPSSDGPDAPGRMATIYSASILARAGNHTNVVVHDVDRMIEMWFSREFLCEENLVSSRGKFWNFGIQGGNGFNSTGFRSANNG